MRGWTCLSTDFELHSILLIFSVEPRRLFRKEILETPNFSRRDTKCAPLNVVATYGRSGASSRVRIFEWLDEANVEADVHDYVGTGNVRPTTLLGRPLHVLVAELRHTQIIRKRVQRLLLHREASPFSRGVLEQKLLKSASLGVFDFDDALQFDDRKGFDSIFRNRYVKTVRSISAADRVIAGNQYLADFASQFSGDVVVIPSCVNPDSYRVKESFVVSDPPLIGWIGTPGNEKYLNSISRALKELHLRTGARLQLVGVNHKSLGDLEIMIDRFSWSENFASEIMQKWDVGIMPIDDRPFERGKCGYKLLQYAASGLPSIGSPVGANVTICNDLGFSLAYTNDEWIEALTKVIEASIENRAGSGMIARRSVERLYSYRVWREKWLAAIELSP